MFGEGASRGRAKEKSCEQKVELEVWGRTGELLVLGLGRGRAAAADHRRDDHGDEHRGDTDRDERRLREKRAMSNVYLTRCAQGFGGGFTGSFSSFSKMPSEAEYPRLQGELEHVRPQS